jgi:hypothetical protein
MHYSDLYSFHQAAEKMGVLYSKTGLEAEMESHHIVICICMGLSETTPGGFPDKKALTPMTYDLGELPSGCYYCAGINPHNLDKDAMQRLDNTLQNKDCVGIKLYAGYYHIGISAGKYDPVYQLAMQYNLPVVIHSGDTFSERGLLKHSHPLLIDDLAVKYPELKIVIAHLGNPWLLDTAEILYKNKNVYADMSGLLVGDRALFGRFMAQDLYLNMFRTALILADRYDKLLFGTDWPLSHTDMYIEFIKKLVPEAHHHDVFYRNALNVFTKLKVI